MSRKTKDLIAVVFAVLFLAFILGVIAPMAQENEQAPPPQVTIEEFEALRERVARLEGQVSTRYDTDGLPVNQGQDRKAYRRIVGEAQLDSGKVTINIETQPDADRQSISFISAETFHGIAWSIDTTNTNQYVLYPVDDKNFMIKCLTDALDSSTVKFQVEGE